MMNYLEKKKKAMLNYVSGGRLPSEYQEVEWIESNNNGNVANGAHIQVGFTPTINSKIKIVIMELVTQAHNIAMTSSGNATPRFGFIGQSRSRYQGTINTVTNYAPRTLNQIDTLELSKDAFIVNDVDYTATSYPTTDFSAKPLPICGFNADRVFASRVRVYECKLWESGNLERDLVPCYRKADDVIGLYDLVYGTFYTNSGTGTFTKGNDV